MPKTISIPFKVRDYECDLQGVVNNSVYQNYLEHARHEYLLSCGINFAELTAQGIHVVVSRAELDYKQSLRPGDEFQVVVTCEREGRLRIVFKQDIIKNNGSLMLSARITGVALNPKGRPQENMTLLRQLELAE